MYPLCRALEEITIGDWAGAESSFKACRDPVCVLVDFIRETFAPLLPVQRSESVSRGKIGISSLIDDMFRNIIF